MTRPAHIPARVWTMAQASGQRNGDHESIVRTAEMLMRRLRGECDANEDKICCWPGLTLRDVRIIRDALMGHDTVFDDDEGELENLREWFEAEVKANAEARRNVTGV